ncbi:hypothetical protein EIP86_004694 [Pleurotus ostreatoroseus]|nr:hypothetical protein EIP86_004694 [Pleurotus ostreatoroseus]
MKFEIATTKPINTPSATPVLTREQVFAGLKIRARDPVKYIPAITSCKIVKEDEAGLTRVITCKPGTGPPGEVTEVVTYTKNVKVDFLMPKSGIAVSSIISIGEDETDLYLTFTFTWNFPNIVEGTEEAAAKVKALTQVVKTIVSHTIEQLREMAKDGTVA